MWNILGLSLCSVSHVKDIREKTAQNIANLCNSSLQPEFNDLLLLLHIYKYIFFVSICNKKGLLKSFSGGFLFFLIFLVLYLLDTDICVLT